VEEQERSRRCPSRAESFPRIVSLDQVADLQPPPDHGVLANEAVEHLLSRLQNARLRSIAVWKWEGYSNGEIATMLGCCTRTIARKLELIRTIWSKEDAQWTCSEWS
jgi:DNA-directed RNA polymerase specialized sigma24 family protein